VSEVVKITGIATGGDGVGRLADGRAVFVPRAAPGERIRLRDGVRLHKNFATAELAEIVAAGTERVAAPCPHYVHDRCGGCQLQHLAYDAQLAAKRAIVGDALRRIGKLDVPDPEIVEAVEEWRYRAKVSLTVKGGGGRGRAVGFHPYDQPSRIFPLADCHITDFRLMALWRDLKPRLDLLPAGLTRLRGARPSAEPHLRRAAARSQTVSGPSLAAQGRGRQRRPAPSLRSGGAV